MEPEVRESRGFLRWTKELARRRVYQTAALYAAIGWGFTEIAVAALDALNLPPHWGKWLVILYVSAFPAVVTLAWVFDIRAGVQKDQRAAPNHMLYWTGGAGVLVSILVLVAMLRARPPVPVPVKPFDLVLVRAEGSGSETSELLLEGLIHDLERALSTRSDLRVFSSTSAGRMLASGIQPHDLPVVRLVEIGSQQVEEEIRLRVSMTMAETGELVWTEVLDDRVDHFFTLQDRLASQLVGELSKQLDQPADARQPDLNAYLAYQRARQTAAKGGRDHTLAALAQVKEAIRLDADYVEAKALLGNLYVDIYDQYPVKGGHALLELEEYLEEAAAISKGLGVSRPEAMRLAVRLETHPFRGRDARGWQPEDAWFPLTNAGEIVVLSERNPNTASLFPIAAFARLTQAEASTRQASLGLVRDMLAGALVRHPMDLELALTHAAYSDDEVDALVDIVSAYPQQIMPLQRLGWARYETGALASAASSWAAAFALDPNTISSRNNLLRVLVDLGATDAARSLVENYYSETARDAEFAILAGALFFSMGDAEMTRVSLLRAADYAPDRLDPCMLTLAELWSSGGSDSLQRTSDRELRACDPGLLARFGDSLRLHRAMALVAEPESDAILQTLRSEVDFRLDLRPDPGDLHLQAVISAIANQPDRAMEYLEAADESGWRRFWYTQWHPAFAGLTEREDYQVLLQAMQARVSRQHERFAGDDVTQGNLLSASLASSM